MKYQSNLGKVILLGVLVLGNENISAIYKPFIDKSYEKQPAHAKQLVFDEFVKLLRSPKSEEIHATESLKYAFKLPKNTEVMIMDADSYINGLKLDNFDKESYRTLKKNGIALLSKFINSRYVKFEDRSSEHNHEKFKSKIVTNFKNYIFKSQTYRDIITCYLARAQAGHSETFRNQRIVPPDRWNFLYGDYADDGANDSGTIFLTSKQKGEYATHSFFKDNSMQGVKFPPGIFVTKLPDVLSHEIGHTLFPINSFCNFIMGQEGKVYCEKNKDIEDKKSHIINSLCSGFTEVQLDKQGFRKWIESINNQETRRLTMLRLEMLFNVLIPNYNPDKELGMLLNFNYTEFFQIMGIALVTYNKRNILVINKMSDIALSAELKLPIRVSHVGGDLGVYKRLFTKFSEYQEPSQRPESFLSMLKKYFLKDDKIIKKLRLIGSLPLCERPFKKIDDINCQRIRDLLPLQEDGDVLDPTKKKPFIKFKPNPNAYGPMLELLGTSLGEYTSKIMFPYGLYSTLASEHRLGACILKDDDQSVERKRQSK